MDDSSLRAGQNLVKTRARYASKDVHGHLTRSCLWKTCAPNVHFLWIVDERKKISAADALASRATTCCGREFRTALRLITIAVRVESRALPNKRIRIIPFAVHTAVHRFEESIGGRDYLIEVAAVDPDRWRAYIVRTPGVPTALMPFYGPTPGEAAQGLRQWLTRAHERARNSVHRSV